MIRRMKIVKGLAPEASEPAVPEPAKGRKNKPTMNGQGKKPKIFRVNYGEDSKPMTIEEAILEMEDGTNYMVYRDSDRDCLSVLLRRPDGNFDLIES